MCAEGGVPHCVLNREVSSSPENKTQFTLTHFEDWSSPQESVEREVDVLLRKVLLRATQGLLHTCDLHYSPPNPHQGCAILFPTRQTGNSQVCFLLRTLGVAPKAHMLEAKHHSPRCRPPSPAEPWEKPHVGEALESGPRTVSRRYLSSLKNKLSSGTWRKSCHSGTHPGPGMQVPEGWDRSWELGVPFTASSPYILCQSESALTELEAKFSPIKCS